MLVQSPAAGWRTLELRIIQNNVALPMSFRTMVLSQSNNATGAPSATEPDLPQLPSRPIISLIRSRLSPYHPGSAASVRQAVPVELVEAVPE